MREYEFSREKTLEGTMFSVDHSQGKIEQTELTLTAGIIYFNERCNIERCLNSLGHNIAHYILIDGRIEGFPGNMINSDDNTDELIAQFFEDLAEKGYIPEITWIHPLKYPWQTQMEKRNLYFRYAQKDGWILVIDADEAIPQSSWEIFWKQLPHIQANEYKKEDLIWLHVIMREIMNEEEHPHYRFLKNLEGMYYDINHWTVFVHDQRVEMHQLYPEVMLDWFKIFHFSSSRISVRKDQKDTFRKWRQTQKIDTTESLVKGIVKPETFDDQLPEIKTKKGKIKSSWLDQEGELFDL